MDGIEPAVDDRCRKRAMKKGHTTRNHVAVCPLLAILETRKPIHTNAYVLCLLESSHIFQISRIQRSFGGSRLVQTWLNDNLPAGDKRALEAALFCIELEEKIHLTLGIR
jgi:hypothetical protein